MGTTSIAHSTGGNNEYRNYSNIVFTTKLFLCSGGQWLFSLVNIDLPSQVARTSGVLPKHGCEYGTPLGLHLYHH